MSTPADFGYAKCSRCGSWRKVLVDGKCAELGFCSSAAGVGKGLIDADTGQAFQVHAEVLP